MSSTAPLIVLFEDGEGFSLAPHAPIKLVLENKTRVQSIDCFGKEHQKGFADVKKWECSVQKLTAVHISSYLSEKNLSGNAVEAFKLRLRKEVPLSRVSVVSFDGTFESYTIRPSPT